MPILFRVAEILRGLVRSRVRMKEKRPVGRPKLGNLKLQFSLSKEAAKIVKAAAKRHKLTRSEFVDLMIRFGDLPETVIRAYKEKGSE